MAHVPHLPRARRQDLHHHRKAERPAGVLLRPSFMAERGGARGDLPAHEPDDRGNRAYLDPEPLTPSRPTRGPACPGPKIPSRSSSARSSACGVTSSTSVTPAPISWTIRGRRRRMWWSPRTRYALSSNLLFEYSATTTSAGGDHGWSM